jgi:D-arabinitol dehydrogenase (NADP+)
MGDKVQGFEKGDRIAADVGGEYYLHIMSGLSLIPDVETCGHCHYCRKGKELFCEHFNPAGVARDGGFADYIK